MVTELINSNLRAVQDGFITALNNPALFSNAIGALDLTNLAAGDNTREVQLDILKIKDALRIGDEYGWNANAPGTDTFKAKTKLFETTLELPRRFVEGGSKAASEIQLAMAQYVQVHQGGRDKFLMLGKSEIPEFKALGVKVANASSSIHCPASVEPSTAGTTETITAALFGGNRATMAAQVIDQTVRAGFLKVINTDNKTSLVQGNFPILGVVHPIMLGYLKSAMWDGTQYIATTNLQYLEANGWTIIPSIDADADYAGANDGTTQIHVFADPKNLFRVGVVKAGQWDQADFFQDDKKTKYMNRFAEILTGLAIPFLDDDAYWKKAYMELTTIGYDTAA